MQLAAKVLLRAGVAMVILSLLCRFLARSGTSTAPADLALVASLAVVATGLIGSLVLGRREPKGDRDTSQQAPTPRP
jgi:drug/metabolite transporter (DMT)-like permease